MPSTGKLANDYRETTQDMGVGVELDGLYRILMDVDAVGIEDWILRRSQAELQLAISCLPPRIQQSFLAREGAPLCSSDELRSRFHPPI